MADSIVEKLIVNFTNGPDYLAKVGVLAQEAQSARDTALEYANTAVICANSAEKSAETATEKAQAATESAEQAINAAQEAATYSHESQAYAQYAKEQSDIASNAAQEASTLAQGVGTMVEEVESVAAGIYAEKVPAWDSTKVYSFPDMATYFDGQTYRCIGTNVPAGTIPPTSLEWVRISVLGGDDFFEIDMQGALMPAVNPTFAYSWQLDEQGNIMPRAASDTLGTVINTYAEQALQKANEALDKANTILYDGIPVELDSAGNVTTTDDTL